MRIIHIVPERNDANGMYRVAELLANEQRGQGHDSAVVTNVADIADCDEVWVHGMWLPCEWMACWKALRARKTLVRMTHGSLSPVYLERQGKWKKRMVGPVERWLMRRADRVVATCEAEAGWIREYLGEGREERGEKREECRPEIVVEDIKRFFRLEAESARSVEHEGLHVLYLGRRHPLKGVELLERAVGQVEEGQRLEVKGQRLEVRGQRSEVKGQRSEVRGVGDRCRVVDAGVQWRRAEEKVAEWLDGVDETTFAAALENLVEEKRAAGEYRFRSPEESVVALETARQFFLGFARKIVVLSDGRCVYFAPDARARSRNASNAVSWAEYAFHAVSNGGVRIVGKNYHERWYNPHKAQVFGAIENVLNGEQCFVRLSDVDVRFDAIVFAGLSGERQTVQVVTRFDELGNMEANLTEVTFTATRKAEKKSPRLVPLAEAVQAVVHHHNAAGSYPMNINSIPNRAEKSKGDVVEKGGRLKVEGVGVGQVEEGQRLEVKGQRLEVGGVGVGVGQVEGGRLKVEGVGVGEGKRGRGKIVLRVVSDHHGDELERDWEWCDVLCLPTLSENFGLVVAEALERGKRVITTDGAPAWGEASASCLVPRASCLVYLRGYRDASDDERVRMLRDALLAECRCRW